MKFKSKTYRTFSINGIEIKGKDSIKNRPTNYIFENLGSRAIKNSNVLDLGSAAGAICFESLQRGAKTATGIEYDKSKITTSIKLKKDFKVLAADFYNSNMIDFLLTNDKKFDLVFLLNIIHHIHDPQLLLELVIELRPNTIVLEMPKMPIFASYNIFKSHKKYFLFPWTISKCVKFITSHGYEIYSTSTNNFAFIGGKRQLIILTKSKCHREIKKINFNEVKKLLCAVLIGPACAGKTFYTNKLNKLSCISAGHFKLDSFLKSKYADLLRSSNDKSRFLELKEENRGTYFYVNPLYKMRKYNNSIRGYRYAPRKWVTKGIKECSDIIFLNVRREEILERQMVRAKEKFSRDLGVKQLRLLLQSVIDHNKSEKQVYSEIKESINQQKILRDFISFVKYSYYPSYVFSNSFLYALDDRQRTVKVLETKFH